jgi:hypothetical protein
VYRPVLVLLVVFLAACHSQTPALVRADADRGSPDDVKTEPGAYGGYDVRKDCRGRLKHAIAIIGRGSVEAPWLVPGNGRTRDEDTAPVWRWLGSEDLTGIGVGVQQGCAQGQRGVSVYMRNWREVDAAVRSIGAGMAAGNLRGEVDVDVRDPAGTIVDD